MVLNPFDSKAPYWPQQYSKTPWCFQLVMIYWIVFFMFFSIYKLKITPNKCPLLYRFQRSKIALLKFVYLFIFVMPVCVILDNLKSYWGPLKFLSGHWAPGWEPLIYVMLDHPLYFKSVCSVLIYIYFCNNNFYICKLLYLTYVCVHTESDRWC